MLLNYSIRMWWPYKRKYNVKVIFTYQGINVVISVGIHGKQRCQHSSKYESFINLSYTSPSINVCDSETRREQERFIIDYTRQGLAFEANNSLFQLLFSIYNTIYTLLSWFLMPGLTKASITYLIIQIADFKSPFKKMEGKIKRSFGIFR